MQFVATRLRGGAGALIVAAVVIAGWLAASPAGAAVQHVHINCAESSLCAEVADYANAFGADYYVGHDEPTTTF
jgi:hypothetical protein